MPKLTAVKNAAKSLAATNPRKTAVVVALVATAAVAYKKVQPTLAEKFPLTDEETNA